MTHLKGFDLLALGFMTFALFLGAGNIIFPPSAGMAAGEHVWSAAFGFLLTGVGLPLLTVVALARVGGGIGRLTQPIGRRAGVAFAIAVYLAIGPLFATPRTAVVSFEMGVAPFTGDGGVPLLIYTVAYFSVVLFLVLNPGRLVDRVGKVITPVLLSALLVLGGAAIFAPAGEIGSSSGEYQSAPLVQGFLQGYLTMDTLGALVFGIVIATAIRDRGISDSRLVTRYSMIAGVIAATGLSLVYLALFYLGATSQGIAGDAQNGVQILTAYVQQTFGVSGSLLLAVVITLACLATAVGLITACGEFFSDLLPVSYKTVVIVFSLFSLLVANQGLTQLISLSVPVLVGLYPLAIVLIALSLFDRLWVSAPRVFVPVMIVALLFGIVDGTRLSSAHEKGRLRAAFFMSRRKSCPGRGERRPNGAKQRRGDSRPAQEGVFMTAELGIFNGHLLQHLLAALWFLFCWVGYTRYATWKGRDTACLASVLHLYREDWMRRLLLRDNRIADASVIGNLERNASFFASSTLIILAGILTLLGSTDRAVSVLADLPFVEEASRGLSELKLLCLAVVFVYAFFTFSWCMRQYNFAAILVGSAPMIGERNVGELERKSFAERAARVISLAANQFNFGLRSYYFGLAMLAWFINSWFFMLVTAGVVLVLYRREFHSDVLEVMVYTETAIAESPREGEGEVPRG